MITLERAKEIAQLQVPDFYISKIIDIGGEWVFSYDFGNPVPPGSPIVCISKSNGDVSHMTIPPLENLDILEKGRIVYLRY